MKFIALFACIGLTFALVTGVDLLADQDKPSGATQKARYEGLTEEEAARLERMVEQTVRAHGTLESANVEVVRCHVPDGARIMWLVENGAVVKRGDVVVRFDPSALKEKILQQEIALKRATASVDETRSEVNVAELQRDEALRAAKAAIEAAKLDLDEYFGAGGEYELRVKEVEAEIVVAQGRLEVGENTLQDLKASGSKKDVARKELDMARQAALEARTALDVAQAKRKVLTDRTRPRRKAGLEAAVEAAQGALARISLASDTAVAAGRKKLQANEDAYKLEVEHLRRWQRHLDDCVVHARRDGSVIYADERSRWTAQRGAIEVGAVVGDRQEVLRMPDLSKLQVRTMVNETKIDRVKVGQSVVLRFNHDPYRAYHGKVELVGHQLDQRSFFQAAVSEFPVVVSLPESDDKLKLGMTAMVEIDVSAPTTAAPKSGVSKSPGGDFFGRVDKNGDGKLDRDEMPEAMRPKFESLDLNKDGFLDKKELTDAVQNLRKK